MSVVASPARDRLLAAALERFGSDGALTATLDQVRRDAGVSVGAMYHHFPDKRALATALFVDGLGDYQRGFADLLRSEPDARRGIEGGVRFHLRWSTANRTMARLLMSERTHVDEDLLGEANRPFFDDVLAWYRQHEHYGAVRPLPFDLVHALWLGPSQEYLGHWLGGRAKTLPQKVAGQLAAAAWNSLREEPR